MSITYPKVCQSIHSKYYIDFVLNNKRYRLKKGNKIKLKLNPNSFPDKQRRRQAELLAKKVYDHVVSNNYSFDKDSRSCELALFDRLIESKLSENLSDHYRKTLKELSEKLREQVLINNTIPIEFNEDYFKTLWSRFKKQSKLINRDNTIFSFRHSGAIDIFKRTGSITKLQKAMGHSSINVSLTYLRGLEVPELTEGDMPELN